MNILRFIEEFPTEETCKEHFRAQREQEGIICKKCGSTHHYRLKAMAFMTYSKKTISAAELQCQLNHPK